MPKKTSSTDSGLTPALSTAAIRGVLGVSNAEIEAGSGTLDGVRSKLSSTEAGERAAETNG